MDRTLTHEFRQALGAVSLTAEAVADVLTGCLGDGEPYLVGSLAAGLGNAGSDVDIHVMTVGDKPGLVPMLFFAGRTGLDVVYHGRGAPRRLAALLPTALGTLRSAPVTIGRLPDLVHLKRLSRWATSIPMYTSGEPLLDAADCSVVAAALVRHAVETMVLSAGFARLMSESNHPFADVAWSRAADAALEVASRTEGQIFVGDKWLPAKLAAIGFPSPLVSRARQVGCESTFVELTSKLGLRRLASEGLVRATVADVERIELAGIEYMLAGGQLARAFHSPSLTPTKFANALSSAVVNGGLSISAIGIELNHEGIDACLNGPQ